MRGRVAVIAALPRELRGLTGRAKPVASEVRRGVHLVDTDKAIFVAAGMGAARVSLAFEAAVASGEVFEVISVGLAGACSAELTPGAVVEAGIVVDAMTGERLQTVFGQQQPVLVTTDHIASVREKARLATSYRASFVDMEAATVGRLAMARGLRFRAIKGISDAHDFELEGLSRFTGKHGSFRTAAFALHTALRPGTWGAAGELGRNSTRALAGLTGRLQEVLAEA